MLHDERRVLRCAIYTRKSSEEGLEQSFNSLDAQREACSAFILSQRHEGWKEIATRYDDGGFSGGNMERPALASLMKDIDAGLIDSVVVYKVDRLTRALTDFAKIVDRFDAKKVSFVSVTQQFNTTTSMGRLTLNVLLSFAQFEREVTGERIRDKIAASKKKGMWMGGRIPMGYDLADRKLVVNENEGEAVRHIYRRYLALGCVSALKSELDSEGVVSKVRLSRGGKTSGGRPHSRGALYELLQNKLYIGQTNHKRMAYPGEHARIIDDELWNAVQARLLVNTQGTRSGVRSAEASLLVGRVFTDAGDRLIPSHTAKGGKRYRYYVSAPGSKRVVRIAASELEQAVLARLREFLGSPKEVLDVLMLSGGAARQEQAIGSATWLADEMKEASGVSGARNILEIVSRVLVRSGGLSIECSASRLHTLLFGDQAEGDTGDTPFVLELAGPLQRTGRQVRLVLGDTGLRGSGRGPDATFVKAAARGRLWYEELTSGRGISLADLASESGVNDRYTSRILRCAFVAPDLVEHLLEQRGDGSRNLRKVLANLPRSWSEQRKLLRPGSS